MLENDLWSLTRHDKDQQQIVNKRGNVLELLFEIFSFSSVRLPPPAARVASTRWTSVDVAKNVRRRNFKSAEELPKCLENVREVFNVWKHAVSREGGLHLTHLHYYSESFTESCKTVGDAGRPCIFPFIYRDKTFSQCTSLDSDTGQPWCATEVDQDGWVVDHAWGDCDQGCPGGLNPCDERFFSIQDGKCIDVSVPGAIPNWFGAPAVKLGDYFNWKCRIIHLAPKLNCYSHSICFVIIR